MICRMANLMKSIGLKKGDTAAVSFYFYIYFIIYFGFFDL